MPQKRESPFALPQTRGSLVTTLQCKAPLDILLSGESHLTQTTWNKQRSFLLQIAFLSPSAECRLPESVHFAESDVILGVVRARSVHKVGNGHNSDRAAAQTVGPRGGRDA